MEVILNILCSAPGCARQVWSEVPGKGLCSMHYQRNYVRKNNLLHPRPVQPKLCRICGTKVRAVGLCNMHYERQRRWGDTEFHKGSMHAERNKAIFEAAATGMKQADIAKKFCLCPSRVWQIIHDYKTVSARERK